jgi:hypothetical protein
LPVPLQYLARRQWLIFTLVVNFQLPTFHTYGVKNGTSHFPKT